ncbi:hypothetical protein GUJ93_ZPchr0007g3187 [Zizania palustris]|uniref:Plant heme peroxidase family profile domain-containing protein n=1 Tax=Zizania palustris TaxID=103762 RepID=A0A8J5T5C8_ZIZPA|nr:hypothetical protein GUJ93_ZPchr0007g3187 [Zizania palustris]
MPGLSNTYFLSGGKVYFDTPSGRRDGTFSNDSGPINFLPPSSTSNISDLISFFAVKGLSVEDMVILSGAHTVGRSHCSSFVSDRLNASVFSDIDAGSPVPKERAGPHGALHLRRGATDVAGDREDCGGQRQHPRGLWEDRFKKSMVKMASIEVKTGYQGQIYQEELQGCQPLTDA